MDNSNISIVSGSQTGTVSIITTTTATSERFERRALPILKKILYNISLSSVKHSKTVITGEEKDYKTIYGFSTTLPFTILYHILYKQVELMSSQCCDTCAIDGLVYFWKGLETD